MPSTQLPRHAPGRNFRLIVVPSANEPHLQAFTDSPAFGGLHAAVLSAHGLRVIIPSASEPIPCAVTSIVPPSVVTMRATYLDEEVVLSHPQLPARGSSVEAGITSDIKVLQVDEARTTSVILARLAWSPTVLMAKVARTPMTATTSIISIWVKPCCTFRVMNSPFG